ncbi:MAG: hypothetical protein KDH96_10840, partial [Candidatus Riesia sp.]|nr:hypothetical protein [Candidatus Riesia sp.]
MGTGYTRQSAGEILTGEIAEAADFNNEFNALEHAFNATTGHSHDGTSGEGPPIPLASSVTGTLPVANGGTGATTLTDGGVLLGSGTGAVTAMSVLSNGQIIVGDGTTDPVALSAFTAYNGYLKHELGGLEADVSAYDGLVKVSGGSTSAVTAPTGTIVGTSDSQTLTNKTITAADNTLTIASTDLSDSASITLNTATQTLTNKTIVAANNTITMASTDLSDTASITLNAAVQTLTNKTISAANNTITIASINNLLLDPGQQ